MSLFADALPAFMPHGQCYYWRVDLLALHLGADAVIALSYFSIPLAMGHLLRKRRDIVFDRVFVLFAAFILLCGITHLLGAVTIWQPVYYTEGLIKLATAAVSAITAIAVWRLMPRAIALPSPGQLQAAAQAREAARDEAREAQRALRLILDTVGEGICRLDRDGRIRFANETLAQLLGTRPDALGEERFATAVPLTAERPDADDPVTCALAGSRLPGAAVATLTRRDGGQCPVALQATPVADADGTPAGAVVTLRDLTWERGQQARLEHYDSLLEKTNRLARVGAWSYEMTSTDGTLWWSDITCRLFGRPAGYRPRLDEAFGHFPDGEPRRELLAAFGRCLRSGERYDMELPLQTADGELRRVRIMGEPEFVDGCPQRLLGAIQDVTELHAAETASRQRETRLAAISRHAPGVAFELHYHHGSGAACLPYLGERAPQLLGVSPQAVAEDATPLLERIHEEDRERLLAILAAGPGQAPGDPVDFRIDFTAAQGAVRREWLQAMASAEARGDGVSVWRGFLTNVTRRKRLEAELRHLAYYDGLTGLPNRLLLEDQLEQAVSRARATRSGVAVLYLDVDDFKNINDGWGHGVGDDALRALAERVGGCRPQRSLLARSGGDELVLLVEGGSRESLDALVSCLQSSLNEPLEAGRHGFAVRLSIGIARYPEDARDAARLLQYADAAVYQAKREGGNRAAWYHRDLTEQAMDRVHLEGELRSALATTGLQLALQDVHDLGTGAVVGAEALVRWQHAGEGWISPGRFIPVAEATGLIQPLGEAVLRAACRHVAAARQLPAGYRVSVNVSPRQLERSGFVARLEAVLRETGAAPQRLELEVTEQAFMRREDTLVASLERIRELGVTVAIDDFGTGFSSLQYLKRLPVDKLKIDRTFVHGIPEDRGNLAIVETAHALAARFGLAVVAEGVETEAEAAALRASGVTLAQGFLFARPRLVGGLAG